MGVLGVGKSQASGRLFLQTGLNALASDYRPSNIFGWESWGLEAWSPAAGAALSGDHPPHSPPPEIPDKKGSRL